MALGAPAFADGHALDLNAARLDTSMDQDGDGTVSDDELIRGNMAVFDTDNSGAINAVVRIAAEMFLSTQ